MIYDHFNSFIANVSDQTTLVALDLGEKTIGVAISDLNWLVATPLYTVIRRKFTLDSNKVLALGNERPLGAVIVGLPLNMNGSEGPRCQSTRAFARNLSKKTDLPIYLSDERLSTVAAERALIEGNSTRLKRSKVIDHVAAAYILQGVLDRITHKRNTNSS